MERELRVNSRIRVPQVHVIDETGQSRGVMPTAQALRLAVERSLDLVEVAPAAQPPVCKILDYGRFRYEQQKKVRAARADQHVETLKAITMSPVIAEHDIELKAKAISRLLHEGAKVRVVIRFRRGRQLAHQDLGLAVLKAVLARLEDVIVERAPVMEGQRMMLQVAAKR